MPIRYDVCGNVTHTWSEKKGTYVDTTLDVELDAAFKAIAGMRHIVKVFIITAETEPGLSVPRPGSLFEIAKGDTGVVWDVFRVRPRSGQRSPQVDRFRGKDGDWGGVLGRGDLDDKRDGDLDETGELGVLDGDGTDGRGIARGVLLRAVDEHEDIAGPVDLEAWVVIGLLDGREGRRQ